MCICSGIFIRNRRMASKQNTRERQKEGIFNCGSQPVPMLSSFLTLSTLGKPAYPLRRLRPPRHPHALWGWLTGARKQISQPLKDVLVNVDLRCVYSTKNYDRQWMHESALKPKKGVKQYEKFEFYQLRISPACFQKQLQNLHWKRRLRQCQSE